MAAANIVFKNGQTVKTTTTGRKTVLPHGPGSGGGTVDTSPGSGSKVNHNTSKTSQSTGR